MLEKLKELITDPNGTLSHTKIWSNVAMFTATIAFANAETLTPELLVAYVASVGLNRLGSKYLDIKADSAN